MASKNPKVREIEKEAKARSLADDGKTSHAERFAIRAQLRDEAGLGKEQRVRGGLARVYDNEKRWLMPALSLAAGLVPGLNAAVPALLGATKGFDREGQSGIGFDLEQGIKGGLSGYGLGKAGGALGDLAGIGGGASGALPVPPPAGAASGAASTSGAIPAAARGGFGGFVDRAKGLLTPENIAIGLQGLNAARGMAKETSLTNEAVGLDRDRWQAGEPLRDAGRSGMLAPNVADTSHLRTLAGRGNPFALPVPPQPPAAPPVRRALPAPLPVR